MSSFILDPKYKDEKLVDVKEHPEFPLLIHNYTPVCQYSSAWDEITKMCRGLITHRDTGEIVARPFSKFFNYEEHAAKGEVLPSEIPVVYPKFDGSLGILYWWNDEPYMATRGSFTSDQAQWASAYIKKVRPWIEELDREYTHLFEIIYPENRIVINYGWEGLVHLASIHTETGKSIAPDSFFPLAHAYPFSSYAELKSRNTPNEEGFVLHYPNADLRVKIKFEDYVKLHKVITGLSQIGIWEMLRDGKDVFEIIRDIPDEMNGWVSDTIARLTDEYSAIETSALATLAIARGLETRKEQAIEIVKHKHQGVVFAMLDGKDHKPLIWKLIRPKGLQTFKVDIDA